MTVSWRRVSIYLLTYLQPPKMKIAFSAFITVFSSLNLYNRGKYLKNNYKYNKNNNNNMKKKHTSSILFMADSDGN